MPAPLYSPRDFGGKEEEELIAKFRIQRDDARDYFLTCVKPRLDRAYKLYVAYNGDRAKEIKSWQANIFIPYINGVVETLMPRILDARPEFEVRGRTEEDQTKSLKLQQLADYSWEVSGMDNTAEMLTRSALVYGGGFMQISWKKDEREHDFLVTKDFNAKRPRYAPKKQVFYDGPTAEWVDNYALWYDWHNIPRESKQYWFKRLVLTGAEIRRRYPMADKDRLAAALASRSGDLTDYASIRNEVKFVHEDVLKGSDRFKQGLRSDLYESTTDNDLRMYEVYEWWRPFDDRYSVMVGDVPILRKGEIPMPFDFKEAPFIYVPYLKLPGEFEGVGIPHLLESPQIMLNMVKNQRLDAVTLNIHKMWIVNPLANVDKKELVVRPFGIIYSPDPNGVREVQFSDVKSSAYREEDLLKSDMRHASGVDDFSMGVGGAAGSATAVRHLRESTLERVRLFVNHLGDGYSSVMRMWLSMYRQFFTQDMTIRIIGEQGEEMFPLIEKDDLLGQFDFKAVVMPSIAGKADIEKKQGMDLFQLLINLPFVDPRKLTSKVLHSWGWALDSIAKSEEPVMPGLPGMPGAEMGAAPPGMLPGMSPELPGEESTGLPVVPGSGDIPDSVIRNALGLLAKSTPAGSPFQEASSPINLLQGGPLPPTVAPIGGTSNPRGANRTGKVNTNLALSDRFDVEGKLLNRAANTQR